ncbi:MAG: hypothetical protein A4E72_01886 [Syntrophus sp. PtaU1.Bin208]|nr:MAG: hypothetical protein A4E72_01886 [Syntrophus sp. PtaU1.Bin208]
MDLLPRMTGSVRNFFSVDNWPYLLAAVAVLGVLILAALLVYYPESRVKVFAVMER